MAAHGALPCHPRTSPQPSPENTPKITLSHWRQRYSHANMDLFEVATTPEYSPFPRPSLSNWIRLRNANFVTAAYSGLWSETYLLHAEVFCDSSATVIWMEAMSTTSADRHRKPAEFANRKLAEAMEVIGHRLRLHWPPSDRTMSSAMRSVWLVNCG